MDKLINDIISLDHQCSQAVEEAKKQKADSKANMNKRKKEIYNEFVAEYQKRLDKKKAELEASIASTKAKNEETYKEQLNSLSIYYNEHKNEWIKTMVERCKQ
ncbi:MAG: hypothetical protein ACTTKU_00825 [Eggerthia catenaformis]|uniref:hypothetical protein n=1 Tax=Eggerthia catenaformis TaxID=31973 RepID=UPI0028EA8002|nr:hypothetical protein [Eggerthia catenaformis]